MIGISWGGFNGLQVAARRPPALKAVISMCASDDRYADDVHYVGGCVLAVDMLPWAATMLTGNALAARPGRRSATAGARRGSSGIERTPPFVEAWLAHQRRDDYWRQGSVCEDYAAIEVPVYAIGGWADGYSNAIPRLHRGPARTAQGAHRPVVARLPAGRRARPGDRLPAGVPALVGPAPQGHRDGDHGRAAPAPVDAGAGGAGRRTTRSAPGAGCPSPRGRRRTRRRGRWDFAPEQPVSHRSIESTGIDAGAWCADGGQGDWPGDQRAEDERSLTFTSEPLDEPIEILGFPEVDLTIEVDRPSALVVVRLCDVDPDGASLLVTRGVLNLNHRNGHADTEPLVPGRRYEVTVRLDAIAQRVPAGHRLRVALSTSYWPWVWPAAEPVTLTLHGGRRARADPRPARRAAPGLRPAGVVGAAGGRDDRARRARRARTPATRRPARTSCASTWDVGGHRRLVDSGVEMDDTPRHDLPHRRRRPALGQRARAVQLGARPRGVAHPRARPTRR